MAVVAVCARWLGILFVRCVVEFVDARLEFLLESLSRLWMCSVGFFMFEL